MSLIQGIILFLAAFFAGALNSVAGGGSFISFPTLIWAGLPQVIANTTNTVALWPGSLSSVGAYRRELAEQREGLLPLALVSFVGSVIGALVLLNTPDSTFAAMIPFLLLLATVIFAFGRSVTDRVRGRVASNRLPKWVVTLAVWGIQLIVSMYGGFFGAGIGIMMLAVLALYGMENIHQMNGVKTVLATVINGVATVTFIAAGKVYWPQALLMIVASVLGGYGGAAYARKIDPQKVRWFVIAVGSVLTVYFFVKTYL